MKIDPDLLSIKEVSRMLGVPAPTLRYWEKEFGQYLKVARTEGNQRRYDDKDIDVLSRIKTLVINEKFTAEGVRRKLEAEVKTQKNAELTPELENEIEQLLEKATAELKDRLISIYKQNVNGDGSSNSTLA